MDYVKMARNWQKRIEIQQFDTVCDARIAGNAAMRGLDGVGEEEQLLVALR